MSRWSAESGIDDITFWGIVIGKPQDDYRAIRLIRTGTKLRDGTYRPEAPEAVTLCQVWGNQKRGYSVVVHGDHLTGLRSVTGFRTLGDCWEYALAVDPRFQQRRKAEDQRISHIGRANSLEPLRTETSNHG